MTVCCADDRIGTQDPALMASGTKDHASNPVHCCESQNLGLPLRGQIDLQNDTQTAHNAVTCLTHIFLSCLLVKEFVSLFELSLSSSSLISYFVNVSFLTVKTCSSRKSLRKFFINEINSGTNAFCVLQSVRIRCLYP